MVTMIWYKCVYIINRINLAGEILVTCAGYNSRQLSVQTSISVLWISRSADVPSENLRPPEHTQKHSPSKKLC